MPFNGHAPRRSRTEIRAREDIGGHLHSGIPEADVKSLAVWWKACPGLEEAVFDDERPGYHRLAVPADELNDAIEQHPAFTEQMESARSHFAAW